MHALVYVAPHMMPVSVPPHYLGHAGAPIPYQLHLQPMGATASATGMHMPMHAPPVSSFFPPPIALPPTNAISSPPGLQTHQQQ